ncbi:MAG: M23 family metallopeptidase [Thermodesulfobacteriota bacterium]
MEVQQQEISGQRKQIQLFAAQLNTIKTKLVNLHAFEKKIRIIANIEKSDEQDSVFGVGGSIPEDLDAGLMITEKHASLIREMHEQVDQLDMASDNQQEGFTNLLKYLDDRKNLLASTPAVSPTSGWITSRFGYRRSPFTGRREFHKGLDISTRIGTPVIAAADGTITFADKKGLLGTMIIIDHGHGMVTRYAHLNSITKKAGHTVKRGDLIAEVGNSGRTTGPHLHYDVRLNGISVNPEKYILD